MVRIRHYSFLPNALVILNRVLIYPCLGANKNTIKKSNVCRTIMTPPVAPFKKKLIYRSNYRGTKEMDILLSKFVKKYINEFDKFQLSELDKFLDFEDSIILNYYNHGVAENNIDKNQISKIFKQYSP